MDSLQHIHWKQGLFLKPQHFQQLSHTTSDLSFAYAQAQSGQGEGIYQLEFDESALSTGVLSFTRLLLVLTDGTLLQYPGNCDIKPVALNQLEADSNGIFEVTIGVARLSRERSNLATSDLDPKRYIEAEPIDTADIFDPEDVVSLQRLNYNVHMSVNDTDIDAELMNLTLCRIQLLGGQYEMDTRFIPYVVYVAGSCVLQKQIKSMKQSLLARYEQLESFNGLYSSDGGGAATRTLMALQVITESIPVFCHFDEISNTPVEQVYLACRTLVAKLSNFSKVCSVTGESSTPSMALVPFQMHNLSDCFGRAFALCHSLLNQLTVSPELLVELQLQENQCFVTGISQDMLTVGNTLYLRLRSEHNLEDHISSIQDYAKLGADSQVAIYLKRALPGVKLRYLHRKPMGVANKPNSYYFSIDVDSFEWNQVLEHQRIGFIWSEQPSDLSVEMIAVRG